MYDENKIIPIIIVFVILVTFPLWYNLGKAVAKPDPKIDTPVIQQMPEKQCIEPKEAMKTTHMKILDEWRNDVVRADYKRQYTGTNGKVFEKSLQNGCMKCHSNKTQFCDQCHNYMQVKPFCWDCHIAPKETK
ncbi:MAG: menaquinol oxidoreductase [Desulfobacca sp.]|nr:menaquinol oxidoreductase [Desulfobacca sp.]